MRRVLATLLGALALSVGLALAAAPEPARAEVPIDNFGLLPSTTQAGGHPDLQIAFAVRNSKVQQIEGLNTPCDCENARLLTVHAPRGLVGAPANLPQCSLADFGSLACPVDSQVGVVEVGVNTDSGDGSAGLNAGLVASAVYNLKPRPGEAGLLAFTALGLPVFESFSARTDSDYGLETRVSIPAILPLRYSNQILWGVPADPAHDPLRFKFDSSGTAALTGICDENGVFGTPSVNSGITAPLSGPASAEQLCGFFGGGTLTGAHSNSPLVPFTQNPTSCGTPLATSIDVLGYDGSSNHAAATYPPTSGCDQLSFNPSLAVRPTTGEADSPAGMDVELTVPQPQTAEVPSPSSIRANTITLPEGFSINPNAADGKRACTDAQARFGTTEQSRCPEHSKIGSLRIDTALLPGPLNGYLYLGEPEPGNRYRVFLVADGFAVHVKLAGSARTDKQTGQVRISFEDLPETPFERFTLHVFGSERGSLATPTRCGTYQVSTEFVPWNSELPDQTAVQHFAIDSGPNGGPCPSGPRPFDPGFDAGSEGNTAGAFSPFSVNLTREDGDQFLDSVDVKTPPGFTGIIAGIPYCSEAAIATLSDPLYPGIEELRSPYCPASEIGTAVGGAGAGSRPLHQGGRVYLAGPYKGAPLSLVVVIPAVTGPYDVGNIVSRVAVFVDPTTGQVSTVSDPLPQIIDGIPLRVRSIRVDIDRPDFALNPTDCSPHSVDATVYGAEGAKASRSAHYQVANCAKLPFSPRLAIRLRGSGRRNAHPALQAVLRANPGDANISRSVVVFPPQTLLDQGNLVNICTRDQFASDSCPRGSIYGRAVAFSPLLSDPLRGPVYLRSNGGARTLPDLVIDLHGQVDFRVVAYVDSVRGGLRTIIPTVPDVPVNAFVLRMQGGARKGLVVNSTDLCRAPQRARAALFGHNGKRSFSRPQLRVRCPRARGAKRSKRRRAGISAAREVTG